MKALKQELKNWSENLESVNQEYKDTYEFWEQVES